jgi:DNA-binding NarL/FixJ family response regulator
MTNVLIIEKRDQIKQAFLNEKVYTVVSNNKAQALNMVTESEPLVLLLDYSFMQIETVSYIKALRAKCSHCKIIVIGDALSDKEVLNCLIAGAIGYQNLDRLREYASKLIEAINAGEAWITRRLTAKLLEKLCGY